MNDLLREFLTFVDEAKVIQKVPISDKIVRRCALESLEITVSLKSFNVQ
jgi:hypothetical protein